MGQKKNISKQNLQRTASKARKGSPEEITEDPAENPYRSPEDPSKIP